MSDEPSYQVVIVGAGIAGLSAANYLFSNGIKNILIIEAKEKAGGRTDTKCFGNGKIELGAQWIHGEENHLCDLVKSSGHLHHKTSWEGKGVFLLSNGTAVDEKLVQEVLKYVDEQLDLIEEPFLIEESCQLNRPYGNSSFYSVGKFLRSKFTQHLSRLNLDPEESDEYHLRMSIFQWAMSFHRIDNSCNQMSELSLCRWSEFEVNPGEHYNNFKEGATSFIDNVLVRQLPPKCLILNSPASKIAWAGANGVKITTRNGNTYSASCVIVTCSMGVLKESHTTLFHPQLPSRFKEAINATGFGPIAKIFLKWEKPWWPETLKGFQFLWPTDYINCCDDMLEDPHHIPEETLKERWPKSITGFDPVLENSNVLLGWLGGPEAIYVETLSEQVIGETCADILRDFTGYLVPDPDGVAVSKWNTDEFFQGAYSFRSIEGDLVYGDISARLSEVVHQYDSEGKKIPAILFAGEAMSKQQYSTLHGAYESGQSQAAKLLEFFQKSTLTNTEKPKTKDKESTIAQSSQNSLSVSLERLTLLDLKKCSSS